MIESLFGVYDCVRVSRFLLFFRKRNGIHKVQYIAAIQFIRHSFIRIALSLSDPNPKRACVWVRTNSKNFLSQTHRDRDTLAMYVLLHRQTDNIHLIKFYWFHLCFTPKISILFVRSLSFCYLLSFSFSVIRVCAYFLWNVSVWFGLTWLWLVLCIWFNFRCFIFRSLFGRYCCVCVWVCICMSFVCLYALFTLPLGHTFSRFALFHFEIYCRRVFIPCNVLYWNFRWGRAEKSVNLDLFVRRLCVVFI